MYTPTVTAVKKMFSICSVALFRGCAPEKPCPTMSNAVNVTEAAFKVGYESPSQFSREYARMFGTPPKRDMGAMRAAAA